MVQGFEVPLTAWPVHAAAVDIQDESGNIEPARLHRDLSRAISARASLRRNWSSQASAMFP
jgi:hypothetical protein